MSFLKNINGSAGYILAVVFAGLFLNSCNNHSFDGMVIFTQVPADNSDFNEKNIAGKYEGAQIVAINPDKPSKSETVLTDDFYSACSPEISYDAKHLLFTAQKNKDDSWQIWEMNLEKGTSKKITDFDESCYGPVYLPKNRLAFSKQMPDVGTGSVHALHTMNLDGTNFSQITFQPHFDYISTVLKDGRLLMLTKQLFPESGEMMYMAMRPNGTKAELFYKGEKNSSLNNQSYETKDGHVYFIERENGNANIGDLISIHQNRPLFTKVNLTSEITGSFYSVLPMQPGKMLVSYRTSDTDAIGLYRFSAIDKSLGEPIYNPHEYHIIEPVFVEAFTRPRDLPDDVNPEKSNGLLLCQNINVLAHQPGADFSSIKKATKIELLGIDKSLGAVSVEEDGSVYLKVIADTPVRIQTLDDNGNIINGPSAWMWIRPFERRGCVGCHEDPELAPSNAVPFAVKKNPVLIPIESSTNKRAE